MLSTTKRKLLTVGLCLILAFALCFGALALTRQQNNAGAEDDYGAITVHKHDGTMLGITIEGAADSGGTPDATRNDFQYSQDKAVNNGAFAPFFGNLYLNGMPVFNFTHNGSVNGGSLTPTGQYELGGYTYLIGTQKDFAGTGIQTFAEGDVVYLKKGFQAIYRTTDDGSVDVADQALTETVLQYDRYFVFDGNDFVPADVLLGVNATASEVAVDGTVTLTPDFLPINFTLYSNSMYAAMLSWIPKDQTLSAWDYPTDELKSYWGSQLSTEMVYTSSDDEIATVSADGVVTGHKPGWVTITATHVDSNEQKTVDILVRGSMTDAQAPVLSVSEGELILSTGIAGTAAESLTVADTAFALIERNGAPLFGADAAVAVTAEGVISTGVTLAEGDLIRIPAGWQAVTSADGTTATLSDSALAHDLYFRYDGSAISAVVPFTLTETEVEMEVRTEQALTVNFAEGIADQDLVWTTSCDWMVSVENGTLQAKNYVTGAANRWAGNDTSPAYGLDTLPESVTVTATHPATGTTASVTVTTKETMEDMKVEASLINGNTVALKFIGADSGRMVTTDYMTDVQRQFLFVNPGHDKNGTAWDRNNDFFAMMYLNGISLTNEVSPGAPAIVGSTGGSSTNMGVYDEYSLVVCTNGSAIAEGSVLYLGAGLRPFAYQVDFGYFFDSMTLADSLAFVVQDGDFVAVSPLNFAAESYNVQINGTVATSLNTLTDSFTGGLWGAIGPTIGANRTVTYEVENTSIATVDENGVVTGVAPGTTTLTATDVNGLTFTTSITVAEQTTVTLPEDFTLTYGQEFTLTAETNNQGASFAWEADNDNVTLNGNGTSATLRGDKLGTTTITVTADGTVSDTVTVTVVPALTASLPGNATSMEVGSTLQITASAEPADQVTISYAASSDRATVSAEGLITAGSSETDEVVITVTAAMTGNETIAATVSFSLEIYEVDYFTFSQVTTAGAGAAVFAFDGALMSFVGTEGMQSAIYLEENRDVLPDFFQKIIIQEPDEEPMTLNDYWWEKHQLQIHVRNQQIEFYWYDLETDENGDWIFTPSDTAWKPAYPAPGTVITFEEGMRVIWGDRYGNYYGNYALAETTEFVYDSGTWKFLLNEGEPFSVVSISEIEKHAFTVTLNADATDELRGEELTDVDGILFNGYTVNEINAANGGDGVDIMLNSNIIRFRLNENAVMDGVRIFDETITMTIQEGFTLPTSYVCEADYTKSYYPEFKWWADPLNEPESDEILTIGHVNQQNEDENMAFAVYFSNENKVFGNIDSAAAGIGAVHVNAVPEWLTLTQWYSQNDYTISTGTKYAVWHGIYINDMSIYDIMFNRGAPTIELQSAIVAVHFSYTSNAIRFVFDSRTAGINGIDWTQPVTIRFDAAVFHTDTGARFAEDVMYVYDPATETWSEQAYEYTITVDQAASVQAGSTVDLHASVVSTPAGGDTTLTFSSSDESIATVDENGVVTGVAEGTATVTVTAADGTTATCTVTVTAAGSGEDPTGCAGCGSSVTGGLLTTALGLLTLAGVGLRKKQK